VKFNDISRAISRRVLTAKKNSPHIFFAGGMVGMVGSTVLACRATLKLSETLDEINKDINDFKNLRVEIEEDHAGYYQPDQYNKDLFYVHVKAAYKITKLYAPSVGLGIVSIAALSGSHVQLSRRNTALMAAYATVQTAFNEYRTRVREELGEEKELDVYHGARLEKITDEDGKTRTVKAIDPTKRSMYSRIFDEYSEKWQKDPELNRIYLECQQQYANDLLKVRGHVFLNDVYDLLGMDRSSAGAVVGWVIGEEGDNYIDFGMYEAYNTPFINGWERSVVLDFNVDGVIYDLIERKGR
jgi:hypothetical protein